VPAEQPSYDEVGLASWYGQSFQGRPTADGEIYEMSGLSAAHATLPLPSIVEVTNLENGRRLEVRLNDRGPFHPGRIIDLSVGAAKALGFYQKGTAKVRVRFIRAAPLMDPNASGFTIASDPTLRWPPPPSPLARSQPDWARQGQASGTFTVQAGAFASRTNAERAASRLALAGRTKVTRRGGLSGLYRVVIGPFADSRRAQNVREQAASLGFPGARVISGA